MSERATKPGRKPLLTAEQFAEIARRKTLARENRNKQIATDMGVPKPAVDRVCSTRSPKRYQP